MPAEICLPSDALSRSIWFRSMLCVAKIKNITGCRFCRNDARALGTRTSPVYFFVVDLDCNLFSHCQSQDFPYSPSSLLWGMVDCDFYFYFLTARAKTSQILLPHCCGAWLILISISVFLPTEPKHSNSPSYHCDAMHQTERRHQGAGHWLSQGGFVHLMCVFPGQVNEC